MGEPVCGRVAGRVVERDRLRIEPLDRLTQNRADTFVVGDDVGVAPGLHDARRVEAPDDRLPLARAGEQERALPGAVRADDQLDARVGCDLRLVDEREPEVDVVLLQDRGHLVELLADERRFVTHGPNDLTCTHSWVLQASRPTRGVRGFASQWPG